VLEAIRRLRYPVSNLWNEESNRHQGMRRLATFIGWQLWKRLVGKPITVTLFNQARFVAYPDCQVSSGILYTRIPDSRNILFLSKHLPGGTLIDVGADVGSVTLLLSDKIDHAMLFEPNLLAAARARENPAVNRLNFKVHELALSDTSGEVRFVCRDGVDTAAQIIAHGQASGVGTKIIQRITFDEFLAQHRSPYPPISVVKIDVEGHENSVLRGMRQFLFEQRPGLVVFEYLQRTNIEETLRFFEEVRYQVFELSEKGPVAVRQRIEPLQDLFASPQECTGAIGVAGVKS